MGDYPVAQNVLQNGIVGVARRSSLPSTQCERSFLSEQINVSTRSTHTKLNRLIIARLPLALPPYCTGPSTYVTGLIHIVPIYHTFETIWTSIIDTGITSIHPQSDSDPERNHMEEQSAKSRINGILEKLYLPDLLRSDRLRDDIGNLGGLEDDELETQVAEASMTCHVAEFTSHIKNSVGENPHILLAYAWVLYMALFSGGRYLRASLELGSESWRRNRSDDIRGRSEASRFNSDGFGFFNFPGNDDGISLNLDFKRRFAEVELFLTDGERGDVVEEAQKIFVYMIGLVEDLDEIMLNAKLTLKAHLDHVQAISPQQGGSLTSQQYNMSQLNLEDLAGSPTACHTSKTTKRPSIREEVERDEQILTRMSATGGLEGYGLSRLQGLWAMIGILVACVMWWHL
jgi:heme oxygenase